MAGIHRSAERDQEIRREKTDENPPTIVAEISKNWTVSPHYMSSSVSPILSRQFEHVIEVNRQRGYRLASWHLSRVMTAPDTLNETIIAVFEKESPA